MLIDTHCHIHDTDYPLPAEEVLTAAHQAGVEQMIVIGTDEASSRQALQFASQHDGVWATIGIHPHDAKHGATFMTKLLASQPAKLVAIGEIGLDYHYNFSDPEQQQVILHQQLALAKDYQLPVVFHVREAFADFWSIYDQYQVPGVLHSYSDNLANLHMGLERGLYIGVNGLATFTKSVEQLAAYRAIPLDRLLLETDAPYLAPAGKRGRPNQPAYVKKIADWLATFYEVELAVLSQQTTANARKLFHLA